VNSSTRRGYRSELRSQQADLTRQRVAEAAADLFVRDGYAATSISAVARAAEVSAQTVYNIFGTKAALLKSAYDIALVGDADPVPLAERADVRALYADPDPVRFLRGYARLGRTVLDRIGALMLQVVAGAAAGEEDLVALNQITNSERLVGTLRVARRLAELDALAPDLSVEQARDRIWTLNSVEVWHLVTGTLGWTDDEYQDRIGDMMCATTVRPELR
jgi:AcrR family transcriptional regulator